MHNCMLYDPIQGQGQGHEASKVPKIALFHVYLLCHLQWELTNDHRFLDYSTISKFDQTGFLIFAYFLRHMTLNLEWSLRLVRPQESFSNFTDIWYVDRGR